MRKFLLGVLLLPAVALAQPVTVDKPVVCDTTERVMQELRGTYGEQPIWLGHLEKSRVGLLINPTTQSWTIVQFTDKTACILEAGQGFQTARSKSV